MKILISAFLLLSLIFATATIVCGQDWDAYAEAWLRGEPYFLDGSLYPNSELYFQEITSGFADPFFFPDINYSESYYYPYFGEDFFRFGYDPYEASQRAIETQRLQFETPFYEFFGERFFGKGEPYPYYQGLRAMPNINQVISPQQQPYIFLPSYSELRQKSMANTSCPTHESLNLSLGYARNRSSFRVYSRGSRV